MVRDVIEADQFLNRLNQACARNSRDNCRKRGYLCGNPV